MRKPHYIKKKDRLVFDPSLDILHEFNNIKLPTPELWKEYIGYVYDYFSPYKNLPLTQRQERAHQIVFGKKFISEPHELKNAIIDYKSTQYDPLRRSRAVYEQKQEELNEYLSTEKMNGDNAKLQMDIMTDNKKFLETIMFLDKEIARVDKVEEAEMQAGKKMSWLEKQQQREKDNKDF